MENIFHITGLFGGKFTSDCWKNNNIQHAFLFRIFICFSILINQAISKKTTTIMPCTIVRYYVRCWVKNSAADDLAPITIPTALSLTHWGWVTHICITKLTIIGSDNGLSPGRCQAITWISAGILSIGPTGTNFDEILIKIHTFSFKKILLKMFVWKIVAILSQPQCAKFIQHCYNIW